MKLESHVSVFRSRSISMQQPWHVTSLKPPIWGHRRSGRGEIWVLLGRNGPDPLGYHALARSLQPRRASSFILQIEALCDSRPSDLKITTAMTLCRKCTPRMPRTLSYNARHGVKDQPSCVHAVFTSELQHQQYSTPVATTPDPRETNAAANASISQLEAPAVTTVLEEMFDYG